MILTKHAIIKRDVISASVDDRTPQERGEEPLTTAARVLSKSRYGSVSTYISNGFGWLLPKKRGC